MSTNLKEQEEDDDDDLVILTEMVNSVWPGQTENQNRYNRNRRGR